MNPRARLTPQMKAYDELGHIWQSFLMYFHTPSFKSNYLNTDEIGFRINHFNNECFSSTNLEYYGKPISILAGGSCAFGVGASSDEHTISSLLSDKIQNLTLNFGGRAFSSTQELILFNQIAHKYNNIKNVTLVSGLNDLYLSQFDDVSGYFGPFFFASLFREAMNKYSMSLLQRIAKFFLWPIFKDNIVYSEINRKNFLPHNNVKKNKIIDPISGAFFNCNAALLELKKNLFIWQKLSKAYNFRLTYFLQPFASWLDKRLSTEEQLLFSFLDESAAIKNSMLSLNRIIYLEYSKMIENLCNNLDIDFYDLNLLLSENTCQDQWIFVDRAHLTDYGNELVATAISKILRN